MYIYFDAIQLYRCTFLNNETVDKNCKHKSIKDTPIMSPYVVLDYFNGHPRSKLKAEIRRFCFYLLHLGHIQEC